MKAFRSIFLFPLVSVAAWAAADPAPADITVALKRSAGWHLAHPSGIATTDWVIAPLYDGLLRTAAVTGDASYVAAVLRFGTQSGWSPRWRVYHADDVAVGHAWLDLYLADRSRAERLEPLRAHLDHILNHPITEALDFREKPKTAGVAVTDRWTWCDALYMAPPTLARLFAITGDRKYLEFLDREFRFTYDQLYDPAEHLFYRDGSYIAKKTPNGKKTFWSRGNGWVYGGLALMLEHLPAGHPTRGFYENLFREMTGAILAAQQSDGLWRPSLLDPAQVPLGETSGSGFFVFGLAWGVNHGLLDRARHWPIITRGWAGLMTRIKPDGFVGYVQAIGAAPAPLGPDSGQDYGTGAFLLAGSEVIRALGGAAKTDPAKLLAAAEAQVALEAKTPRAYARLVPERKDDLAWENDKVAFRVYGPALRDGVEDSGIDVWCKSVRYPIIDKWYRQDLTAKISYHKDHGEGYDGYHVGDTRGCGGLALVVDGKLITADTYQTADIFWTTPDVAEFATVYEYPEVAGRRIIESRRTRLRLGERLSEITSRFTNGTGRNAQPIAGLELVIGLAAQKPGAAITLDQKNGVLALYELQDGKGLGTGVVIEPARVLRLERWTPGDGDKGKGYEHALAHVRTDDKGAVHYRAGFAWAGDGEINDADGWLNYLVAAGRR